MLQSLVVRVRRIDVLDNQVKLLTTLHYAIYICVYVCIYAIIRRLDKSNRVVRGGFQVWL